MSRYHWRLCVGRPLPRMVAFCELGRSSDFLVSPCSRICRRSTSYNTNRHVAGGVRDAGSEDLRLGGKVLVQHLHWGIWFHMCNSSVI
jgi:hypothetical protein